MKIRIFLWIQMLVAIWVNRKIPSKKAKNQDAEDIDKIVDFWNSYQESGFPIPKVVPSLKGIRLFFRLQFRESKYLDPKVIIPKCPKRSGFRIPGVELAHRYANHAACSPLQRWNHRPRPRPCPQKREDTYLNQRANSVGGHSFKFPEDLPLLNQSISVHGPHH